MTIPNPNQGDIYLLFQNLPYDNDYYDDLPLMLSPSVCIDKTPSSVLEIAGKGVADFLLPGYSVPLPGNNNYCLRCFGKSSTINGVTQENLLFLSVLSLRLNMPLKIEIEGQFSLGDLNNHIKNLKLYHLSTPWDVESENKYTPDHIRSALAINNRLLEIHQLNLNRLLTGLIIFEHVTLGLSKSYQLAYLGLFASLEAIFGPLKNNKADTLSSRVSYFLGNYEFPAPLEDWLKKEYIESRSKITHGLYDATFDTKLRSEKAVAFGLLHEITRLSLLGFLGLDSQELEKIINSKGNNLQRTLDNLKPASGEFLKNQRCYAR